MFLTDQIDKAYDIIVVGAGPAGSMAAWQAARQQLKVLLLEKDREVGTPVRCAEGVAKKDLENLLEYEVDPGWIAAEISRFRLVAPDGTAVYIHIDEIGYVLHRRRFDYDLALRAASAGARLVTAAEVFNVLHNGDEITGVEVLSQGRKIPVKSKIVIAADGVESRVARWAGIDSTVKTGDMETCVQFTLAGIPLESDTCDFYFSREFAPGGYAWIFPKGQNTANVGLGISGNHARWKNPQAYMEIFLKRYFPQASVVSDTVGGVPVDKTMKKIVTNGFMVAGDAAHQANPISGGGIVSGMIAGKLAGEVAAEAIKKNKTGERQLMDYPREWHRRVGKSHQRFYRLKEALMKFEDHHFNTIAGEYLRLKPEKQNLANLFKIAFKSHPAFIIDVIKLFSPV
jgi:digeranylgeranylglycerophospholipid reductase